MNVLVTIHDDRPEPKIIDFGVAKATAQRLTKKTIFTEMGQLIGTPEYMSPEGELDWITMKAMAKDRTQRYASASELAADITRYLSHEPVLAGPPSAVYRLKKYVRRHKVGVAAGALVMAAMIIGMTGRTIGLLKAVKAERKAKEGAETAKQISDFLVGLFQVSDPGEARGNTITAREILDKGAEKISIELQNQPKIQARLMETMGNVCRSLGLYKLAGPIFEKSLEIKRSIFGNDHLEVADNLRVLGILYDAQGRYEDAESLFKESLEILENAYGPDHQNLARNMNSLAVVYWNQGKYDKAEPYYVRSEAIFKKALGEEHPYVAYSFREQANLYRDQGQYGKAEGFYNVSYK